MTAPSGGAAAVWVDVLPDMSNFGARLAREAAGAGGNAGERLGDEMGRNTQSGFSRHIGKIVAAGAAVGVALGASLVKAMDVEAANDKLAAQLGLTGKDAQRYGDVAGRLYSGGFADNMGTVNEALRSVTQNIGGTAIASEAALEQIAGGALTVANVLDQDLGGVTKAVGQLMRTGLAANATEALDLITYGLQNGADRGGDFVDSMNESALNLKQFGFTGQSAIGIITQAMDAGAPSVDAVTGALEELIGNAGDSADVFTELGFNGAQMARDLSAGGPAANAALDQLLDRLRGMQDPAARSTALVGLFGEEATAMQGALLAIDPSEATARVVDFAGTTAGLSSAYDNASSRIAAFSQTVSMMAIDVIGNRVLPIVSGFASFLATNFGPALAVVGGILTGQVIPAVQSFAGWVDQNRVPITIVAGLIATLFIPHLVALGVTSTITGVKTAAAWVVTQVSAVRAAAVHSAQVVAMIGRWTLLGAQSLVHAAKVAGSWLIVGGINAVAATVATTVAVANMIARWVFLGAQSLIQAARVAAAWLIAMGPIGLVIAAVVGVVALIIANWDTVKKATIAAWNAVSGAVATAWAAIKQAFTTSVAFVQNLWNTFWATLQRVATTVWNAIRAAIDTVWNAIKTGFNAAVNFIAGLWNRFWDGLRNVASTVFGAIRSTIDTVWGAIRSGFSAATSFVAGVWGSFWGGLRTVAATVFGSIRSTIDTVLGAVRSAFQTAVDVIGRVWGGIRSLLAKPINFMINTVYMGGIKKAWDVVAGILPGIGPLPAVSPIPEFARGGPVGRDMILRAGEAGPEFVLSNPAVQALGGLDAVDRWHRELVASRPKDFLSLLNSGQVVEGADHDGPGSRTTGFGGVKPHVAQAGHFLQNMFGIGSVAGVGQRANASDHPKGLALDFMTYNDQAKGDRLVNYLTPRAGHFAVKYIIWRQRINSGGGWRGMEDRGSVTANHFDHPHVSFLPGPGGEGGFSGEGGFFDIKAWIREQLEGITNPVISALRNAFPVPPRFNEIPPSAATAIRDSALDFLLGKAFDSGGLASGRGLMFKNINEPERVLSPRQTAAFEQLVAQLSGGPIAAPVADRGTADDSDGLGQKFDELIALLRARPFAPITVEDRSGNPQETARSVQLALRMRQR
jgi:phage-related minor tail protein